MMPLKKGSSDKTFAENMSEMMASFKRKGSLGGEAIDSMKKARKKALAIAFNVKGKK